MNKRKINYTKAQNNISKAITEGEIMTDFLPSPEKIRMSEENGNIVLSPLKNNPNINELFGMFNNGKLSSYEFIKEKALEKKYE